MEDRYLTPEQVCDLVPGMSKGLLNQMRFRGDGPPYIKPTPRKVVYSEASVRNWLKSREKTPELRTA